MKIAHWLLYILREPTPGLHLVAKYSSLAKFSGTKVSSLHHLADGGAFQGEHHGSQNREVLGRGWDLGAAGSTPSTSRGSAGLCRQTQSPCQVSSEACWLQPRGSAELHSTAKRNLLHPQVLQFSQLAKSKIFFSKGIIGWIFFFFKAHFQGERQRKENMFTPVGSP